LAIKELTPDEITASLYAALEAEFPPMREPGWISTLEYSEHAGITIRSALNRLNRMVTLKGWKRALVFDPEVSRTIYVYKCK
jgi:hypothetical protein